MSWLTSYEMRLAHYVQLPDDPHCLIIGQSLLDMLDMGSQDACTPH